MEDMWETRTPTNEPPEKGQVNVKVEAEKARAKAKARAGAEAKEIDKVV